jgi:hypothetical protein
VISKAHLLGTTAIYFDMPRIRNIAEVLHYVRYGYQIHGEHVWQQFDAKTGSWKNVPAPNAKQPHGSAWRDRANWVAKNQKATPRASDELLTA